MRSSTSPRWSAARRRRTPISAIGSTSMARAPCWMPAARSDAPRLIFASSLAVYGGELPPAVGDDTPLHPQTSYGAQKAIGELLVNDYSRKGFIDGRALQLPTVVVRPGLPNRAASTFASSIIREPLAGKDAVCPVSPETVMALASPRRVVAALAPCARPARRRARHRPLAAGAGLLGERRRDGRRRCAARAATAPTSVSPGSPTLRSRKIVSGWPLALSRRAPKALGFEPRPASTKPSRPLSRTTSRYRRRWSDRSVAARRWQRRRAGHYVGRSLRIARESLYAEDRSSEIFSASVPRIAPRSKRSTRRFNSPMPAAGSTAKSATPGRPSPRPAIWRQRHRLTAPARNATACSPRPRSSLAAVRFRSTCAPGRRG